MAINQLSSLSETNAYLGPDVRAVICAARLCGASLKFPSRARISVPRCTRGSSMRT